MKVAIIGAAYPYRGGIASFTERLARELNLQGHEVDIYTFTLQYPRFLFPGKTQYSQEKPPTDLTIKRAVNAISPFNWVRTGNRLGKASYDLVVVKYWLPFFGPALGTILRRIKKNKHSKIIAFVHNWIPHEKRPGDVLFSSYFSKPIDAYLAMSNSVLDAINAIDPQKPKTLSPHPLFDHFGAAITKEKAQANLGLKKAKYILFFGVIRKYKGLDILLKAFANKALQASEISLIIAGEYYDDPKEYQALIEELNVQDRVFQFDKFIPDAEVKNFFCAADLVVQPYRSATQSGVTQIAYHFNKPMIVSNVGGLPELCPDNKVAFVVEPEPSAISSAIERFYSEDKAQEFTANLEQEKKRFTWDVLVGNLMHLQRQINGEVSDENWLKEIDSTWTLFLDRDGVINQKLENDYVKNIEEFSFLPGAVKAIAQCAQIFGRVIIVTNQQGIGKKLMSEEDLEVIHHFLRQEIIKNGGKIDAIYFAPQLAQEKSMMRKPEIGMALQAKKDFPEIEFKKSIMIGDSESDMAFGTKAGMRNVFIGESAYHFKRASLSEFAADLLKSLNP